VKAAYDQIGRGYSNFRSTDPDIAAAIERALGSAESVLNIGAGTGSYEACAPRCVAIEPSSTMIAQRSTVSAPAIQGTAEQLPLQSGSFDAAMALLTVHHWADLDAGLRELRRVARRAVIFTFDAAVHDALWLFAEYLPEATTPAWQRPPAPEDIGRRLGGARVTVVPVPARCRDGFTLAYWQRPAAYLDPDVRKCCSSLAQLPEDLVEERMGRLAADLESGRWESNHCQLLNATSFDGGLRLVVTD
jgi:ubiquinone/menaquinone biosynthesis C-methylase UbiE